jgi:putative holliday junction resolvase
MQYIGIDYGTKRIGLALGDSETKIASPFKVVSNIEEVATVIAEEKAGIAVIGMPYSLQEKKSGQTGLTEDRVIRFVQELKKISGIKIIEIDERLTTKQAKSLDRHSKAKADKDAISAMLILQAYFDTQHQDTTPSPLRGTSPCHGEVKRKITPP